MIKSYHYIGLFTLLLLTGLLGWYIARPEQLNLLDSQTLAKTPDVLVYHLSVVKFDKTGKPAHRLLSPLMKHFSQSNLNLMQTPEITVYQNPQAPWLITADKGIAFDGMHKILFNNNVVLHQSASSRNKAHSVTTEKLYYYPKKQYADTDVEITLTQPGTLIKAQGMQAFIDEKRIKLNHARGRHETG